MTSRDLAEDVRLAVYRQLSATGRAPTTTEIATITGTQLVAVEQALRALHDHRDLVLGADGEIVMAHPFATIPLGFSVMGARTLWWGGCAWDSFAIPHLVPGDASVLVATTCPGCGRPHAFVVERDQPPAGSQVAHFLTPTSRVWDDVVNSCARQRIFCDEACVDAWLAATANQRGYVMDLATLWGLARGWYRGRLERGYRRREPTEAVGYFREVGLSGPFWGLP
jgi:alkylmercury lyase-like protein